MIRILGVLLLLSLSGCSLFEDVSTVVYEDADVSEDMPDLDMDPADTPDDMPDMDPVFQIWSPTHLWICLLMPQTWNPMRLWTWSPTHLWTCHQICRFLVWSAAARSPNSAIPSPRFAGLAVSMHHAQMVANANKECVFARPTRTTAIANVSRKVPLPAVRRAVRVPPESMRTPRVTRVYAGLSVRRQPMWFTVPVVQARAEHALRPASRSLVRVMSSTRRVATSIRSARSRSETHPERVHRTSTVRRVRCATPS